jgi:uncharacterized protein (TIGR01244 family)
MKIKLIYVVVVVTTLANTLALADGAVTTPTVSTSVVKSEFPGIANFSQIDQNRGFGGTHVGFGGATEASAMPALRQMGFATIISLRLDSEQGANIDASRAAAEAAGLKYIHIPFDMNTADSSVVNSVLAAMADSENQPVYIHCGSATRVASLWMIGRVLKDGWAVDQASAEAELIAQRPASAIAYATSYLNHQEK